MVQKTLSRSSPSLKGFLATTDGCLRESKPVNLCQPSEHSKSLKDDHPSLKETSLKLKEKDMYDQTPSCLLDPPQIRSRAVHRTRNACERRWVRVDTANPHIDAPLTRTGADVTRHLSILKPRWNGSKQVGNRYFFTPKVVKHAAPM